MKSMHASFPSLQVYQVYQVYSEKRTETYTLPNVRKLVQASVKTSKSKVVGKGNGNGYKTFYISYKPALLP